MESLEQIKKQLDQLTIIVNKFDQQPQTEYTFTKQQMVDFVRNVTDQVIEAVKADIRNVDLDEGVVDIELNGREIEVDLDSRAIIDEVIDNIVESFTDDEIQDTINSIYPEIKK